MPLTETKIYDSALHYLQRYAAPVEQLRRVLQRKLIRAQLRGEEVPAEAPLWIEKAVARCVQHGYVDDANFAENKVASLRRQGRSRAFIQQSLQQKGVAAEVIRTALGGEEDADLEAAKRTVKRRRLGRDVTPEGRQKDLARLLRAGFSMKAARAALSGVEE